MELTRRMFLGSVAACAVPAFGAARKPRLMLGVLSDLHICNEKGAETVRKALEFFRRRGVDAVLVSGDIAESGNRAQLKVFADTWYGVFPGDKAPDGSRVERLFVYGNHDFYSYTWGGGKFEKNTEDAKANAISYGENYKRFWKEFFHEEFQPIWLKRVKGVPFIGAHWGCERGLEKFLKEHAAEIDPKLPLVYTQHAHPKDTCIGAWAWGHDDGFSTRVLSAWPNAVAFTGHSHYTLTDERSVWQGAFTSINAGCLRYSSTDYSLRENFSRNGCGFVGDKHKHRMSEVNTKDGRQGMLVSFYDDRLEIERREFVYDQSLGDDWIVPFPAGRTANSFAERAKARVAPEFPSGAQVTVETHKPAKEGDVAQIVLRFPAAEARQKCRVFEYEISAVLCEDDVELIQLQRRMMSPDFYLPESKLHREVEFVLAEEDLPIKGHYRFAVRPIECYGKRGKPIYSAVSA